MVFGIADGGEGRQRPVLRLEKQWVQPFTDQCVDVDVRLKRSPVVAKEEEGIAKDRLRGVVDIEVVPDDQISGRMRLIIPLKKQTTSGEE